MEHKDTSIRIKDQEKSKLINSNNKLEKLKSDYFIQKLFGYIQTRIFLKIIKYNINIQKRLNININSLASSSAGAPALKYGDVNTVTPSPGEVKGLIIIIKHLSFVS